ncbi:MAG: D-cysteine desulfhydrase family protein [Ignavibacteriaceae bacterium]|nr:D-cysteine desulfhydrase family protein [Ignavibacteriaceae bacterium]
MNHSLDKILTIKLASLPTPLDEAKALAEKIGLSKLFIKRDDLTGLAGGGNKARKLEYDFAEIINGDYDVVLTAGGIQSNHARMTAAAARKLGLDVKLVLGGPDFEIPKGNLLLDVLFNAEIRYLIDDDANSSLESEMKKWADELSNEGRKPFVIPIGGSTALGALGYVKAMEEISTQLENDNVQIIIGVGSCGTFAGTILGSKIFIPDARVIGISVSRTSDAIKRRTKELINESASLINYKIDNEISIECYDNYHEEYGIITETGKQAIDLAANLEGILLDPIYTGKVMAGLIDLTSKKVIDKNIPVVFIHTGGMPIIFSFENELSDKINCVKIYK